VDVAKHNERIMGASHVENVADLACRTALEYRGVAHLAFPVDLQEAPAGSSRQQSRDARRASQFSTQPKSERQSGVRTSGRQPGGRQRKEK
jgi:thiamine pyrophosphate-dependent acetolactate synthase large subunit-like protein